MKGITWWIKFLIVFILVTSAFAQEIITEDQEETTEENCVPDSLSTPYKKFAGTAESNLDVRQWYSFGSEHLKNTNYKAALPYLWKVYYNDSSKYASNAISKIAQIYYTTQKADSTLLACYLGLQRFPDQQTLHYYAGAVEAALGRVLCAIPHYEELVKQNPKEKSYLSTLAFLYYKNGDSKAVDMQQRVVDLDPTDAKASEDLALYSESLLGSALEAWKKAWLNDPTNFSAGRNYARSAITEGKYQEAIDPLNKIIAKEPTNDDYKTRASAYDYLGQYSNAIRDYSSVLTQDKNNPDIMLNIAYDHMMLKQYSTANSWANKALRAKPGYGKAYIFKGDLYVETIANCNEKSGSAKELEDKIVYERAREQYRKAMRDLGTKSQAETKYNNLAPFIRTKEDTFMHPNAKITSSCYSFVE